MTPTHLFNQKKLHKRGKLCILTEFDEEKMTICLALGGTWEEAGRFALWTNSSYLLLCLNILQHLCIKFLQLLCLRSLVYLCGSLKPVLLQPSILRLHSALLLQLPVSTWCSRSQSPSFSGDVFPDRPQKITPQRTNAQPPQHLYHKLLAPDNTFVGQY